MTERPVTVARRSQPITLESRGAPTNVRALAQLLLARIEQPRLRPVPAPEFAPAPPDPVSSGR